MSMKSVKTYGYEVLLDDEFFPPDGLIIDGDGDLLEVTHNQYVSYGFWFLHDFLNKNFTTPNLRKEFRDNRAFVISTNQSKIKEAENFCNFLIENNILSNLVKNDIATRKGFTKGLNKAFEVYLLSKELKMNNESVSKRPKI